MPPKWPNIAGPVNAPGGAFWPGFIKDLPPPPKKEPLHHQKIIWYEICKRWINKDILLRVCLGGFYINIFDILKIIKDFIKEVLIFMYLDDFGGYF